MAASIHQLFDKAELHVAFLDNRPYKKHVALCIPRAKTMVCIPPDTVGFPIESFDPYGGRVAYNDHFEQYKLKDSDIVLCGTMLAGKHLAAMPAVATLRPREDMLEASDNAMLGLGLDPEKWVATVYWKEPGYQYRIPDARRDITDTTTYIAVIRHIIENLGGQVVRLGHATETELPNLPGLIDLAKRPNSEWLQLYACSISRFLLGSLSGPVSYGPAFNVPTVVTDANKCLGAYRPHDYILTQGIEYDGKLLRQTDAFDAGWLIQDWERGKKYFMQWNSAAELIEAADEMFKSTTDCLGWRGVVDDGRDVPRPNFIALPIPERYPRELLIPPSRRHS
jgi:putative glycosyltransferase (TIGR04372 family)